jgi:hypothetical protein
MKEFDVTIKATVTKTYRVKAKTQQEAGEKAHQVFSVLNDDTDETYEQDTESVVEISKKKTKSKSKTN